MALLRVGIAHHLGWAVAVTASEDYEVVDRRRLELIDPGLPAAPIHHEGGSHLMHRTGDPLDDGALAALVAKVRASAVRTATGELENLAAALPAPIGLISVRAWAPDFPVDIATLRRAPYESRADSVMYCQVLAEIAAEKGWSVRLYDAKDVERQAAGVLGSEADRVLREPRQRLGPPWAKDHRTALAATVVAP